MPPNLVLLAMESYMNEDALKKAWSDHSRLWEKNIWVYPVISRRAEGLSIGVNLNLDKHCTFSCVYCQVDRTVPGPKRKIDIDAIDAEIESIFPEVCRRLRDIQKRHAKHDLQLTLNTNATMLDRDNVREGLKYLTAKKGEIWAKLDAGTDAWYKKVPALHRQPSRTSYLYEQNLKSPLQDRHRNPKS